MAILLRQLVFLTLKLMGIKRDFSQNPIDYIKIRKSDQKRPPKAFYRKFTVTEDQLLDSTVFKISPKNLSSTKHIIYVPGGAFISGPAPHHWTTLEEIISKTQASCWVIDYPKAPEVTIETITANIDAIFQEALKEYTPQQLLLIGDSVGANLILTLVQRLIENKQNVPKHLILITPVFDSSMTNPAIALIEEKDPMLGKAGVLSAKEMCANGIDLKDPLISPIYGSFAEFPATTLFLGGRDIMYPDGQLAVDKMKEQQVPLTVMDEADMPHIFPLLPLMSEARKARARIIQIINS